MTSLLPQKRQDGRILGGVCAGIAENWQLDVTLVRLAFLVLSFAWGLGLIAYGALWIGMPEGGAAATGLRGTARHNVGHLRRDFARAGQRFSSGWRGMGQTRHLSTVDRRWLAVTVMGAGVVIVLGSLGAFSWLNVWRAVGIAMAILGASMLIGLGGGGPSR